MPACAVRGAARVCCAAGRPACVCRVACASSARCALSARASASVAMTKRVLVTGANKGIGLAVVERILREQGDAELLLGARDAARGEAARQALLAKDGAWAPRLAVLRLDVTDAASVADAAAEVASRYSTAGALYGLVNNAGVAGGGPSAIIEANLRGVRRVTDAFSPLLADGGRVVNVSSGSAPMFVEKCTPARQAFFLDGTSSWETLDAAAREFAAAAEAGGGALTALGFPDTDMVAYGFSKAALNVYTMQLARALAPRGIRVNACSPGFIATDLVRTLLPDKTPESMGALAPEKGTVAIHHLLFDELPPGCDGLYFGSDGLRSPLHKYRSPGSAAYEGE